MRAGAPWLSRRDEVSSYSLASVMSQSAAAAAEFYRHVARSGRVWTIRDSGGFPAPADSAGQRSMPFWSSVSRAQRVIDTVAAYRGFVVHELSLEEFRDRWLPGLRRDGLLVGVNWSGAGATGYDVEPDAVLASIATRPVARRRF